MRRLPGAALLASSASGWLVGLTAHVRPASIEHQRQADTLRIGRMRVMRVKRLSWAIGIRLEHSVGFGWELRVYLGRRRFSFWRR